MTPAAAVLLLAIGLAVSVVVIRVATAPLLAELRALRVQLAADMALDRARREAAPAPAP